MTGTDVCDHTGIRFCNLCQPGHLAKITDSHFQNCDLIFITKAEYCQWKSQLIVEIPLGFQYTVFFLQHRGNHLFCAGLSDTSGDTDYFDIELLPVVLGDPFDCLQRRCNLNVRSCRVCQLFFT